MKLTDLPQAHPQAAHAVNQDGLARSSNSPAHGPAALLPEYLRRTYSWAYLDRRTLPWLDRQFVVSAILWGNADRLIRMAVEEFRAGQAVLQAACVYGDFSRRLVERLGPAGRLTVADVAPIQIANLRRKLAGVDTLELRVADLAQPLGGHFDAVCCFFLLHELPQAVRRAVVANLLALVPAGGKVVFVDYHRPQRWHPLRPLMERVFRHLEPYAQGWIEEDLRACDAAFEWSKTTCFGGLYQKLVATRHA